MATHDDLVVTAALAAKLLDDTAAGLAEYSSGDDDGAEMLQSANTRKIARRAGFSWDGLVEQPASERSSLSTTHAHAGAHTHTHTKPRTPSRGSAQAWSFRDAIAHIDSQDARQGRKPVSTLAEKIRAAQAPPVAADATGAGAHPAKAGSKSGSKPGHNQDSEEEEEEEGDDDDDDDEEEEEEDDDEEEVDAEIDDDETGSEDDGDSDDDEDEEAGDHSDEDAEEDAITDEDDEADVADGSDARSAAEDGMDVDDEEGSGPDASDNAAAKEHGHDLADKILAAAKPNPFRARTRDAAAHDPEEYKSFFAADPFADGGATDVVKNRAGTKRARPAEPEDMADAAAAFGSVVATTNSGAVVTTKEPSNFAEMNLSRPLLRAITTLGFKAPTPIQRRCIPLGLAGHDLCGSAVTGSGKTAAYLLPILERLLFKPSRVAATRVVILTPTRELATQVHSMASALAQYCKNITVALVVGGVALKPQEAELRARPDIIVATPGRLLDHIRNTVSVHCDDVDVLVLDEADRLLEMGFEDEVNEIVRACPVGRQTLLFSATMTARVDALAKLSLRNPIRIVADALGDMASRLSQEFVRIRAGHESDREPMLMAMLTRSFTGGGVLVFAVHKYTAHRVAILCGLAGLRAAELHGNLTQRQRLEALEDFREGKVDYLIATDLAGRGLDISGVRVVINMEMPAQLNAYIHRVGRTARAGRAGVAVTLVSENQRSMMKEIVKRAALNVRSRMIPADVVAAWRARIEGWSDAIARVATAEREERALRLAEMEADRAHNLLEHADEIKSRPARTWFQTEREKEETRKRAAVEVGAVDPKEAMDGRTAGDHDESHGKAHNKPHRLTRKKRRRMEHMEEMEREDKRIARAEKQVERAKAEAARASGGRDEESGAAPRLDPKIVQARRELDKTKTAIKTQHSTAKKVKSSVRVTAAKLGVPASRVEKSLKAAARSKPKRHAKEGAAGGAKGSAFATEARNASQTLKHTGASGRAMPSHKPGRKSFKSGARFKRR